MPGKVFNVILAFPVRIIGGLTNNLCAATPCTIVVSVHILDSHHDSAPQSDTPALFDQDNRSSSTHIQLSAMIPHANAEGESERGA